MALAKGARQRGARSSRTSKVTKVHTRRRPRHRRLLGAGRRARHDRGRHRRQLRRHVGARARRAERRHHPAARLRAFLSRHRADPRADPPAGAARAGRMRLLQGGRRQDDARRLRAGRQAVGHGRHSARISASTSCPRISTHFEPILEMGVNRMPMLGSAGIHTFFNGPESFTPDDRYYLGEAPELARLLRGRRLQLDRHRLLGRRRHGAGAMDQRRRAALRPLGSRHPPRPAVPEATAAISRRG